jgi:hypothetical protein
MKITVLTILILMLMAGLAMVQMDANTENQIQVLRETEMLTTQGAATQVDECTERSFVPEGGIGPKSWACDSSNGCVNETDIHNGIDFSYKIVGVGYNWCMGQVNVNKDCNIWPRERGFQRCAAVLSYWGHDCDKWRPRHASWIKINIVVDALRIAPCVGSSS